MRRDAPICAGKSNLPARQLVVPGRRRAAERHISNHQGCEDLAWVWQRHLIRVSSAGRIVELQRSSRSCSVPHPPSLPLPM